VAGARNAAATDCGPPDLSGGWTVDGKIKTGSVFEIAEVLRDLRVLRMTRELAFGERKMLDTAGGVLVSVSDGIAMARRQQPETSEDRVDGPVTGSWQRTRYSRTTRSQCTAPRGGSLFGFSFSPHPFRSERKWLHPRACSRISRSAP